MTSSTDPVPPVRPSPRSGSSTRESAAREPATEPDSGEARTPAYPVPLPTPDPDKGHDLSLPGYFLNRELTWLNFNYRVLREAEDDRVPILERVKFLAIVGSNLDEFFMKRIGGLKQQVGAGVQDRTVDGLTPAEQIALCHETVRDLETRARHALKTIRGELLGNGIRVVRYEQLDEAERKATRTAYYETIFPLVTPQATDPAHPFPFISNLSLNLLVTLRYKDDASTNLARIKVPVGAGIPRYLRTGDATFVPLEDVMAHNLDLLFPDMEVESCEVFRVTRNANTETDEERADDLLQMIESELRERRFAPIVRVEVDSDMAPLHRGMLAAELGLDEQADVFDFEDTCGLRDLMEIAGLDIPELHDPPHHPVDHPDLTRDRSIFHVIRDRKSILLSHPYESFSTSVGRFLREASQDPKVRAIKMSLYRTSADSNVIDHLVHAARNGKQVAVVVELKARFDEAANIRWANRMEEAGIHVTYGVVGLKTHNKVILVVRQDYDGLRRYAHIGTGNYHAGTARLYSDMGLFSSKKSIGEDLTELFNYLTTGYKPRRRYRKLLVAPKTLKPALLEKIEREIDHKAEGRPGRIRMKINALEDQDITRALYRASQAGVTVDLVVRDTCRLRAGVPGLSETVTVVSVVGRFLEHARIFHFGNGGEDEYYIGSADLMKRNLESRNEVLAPVEAQALRDQLDRVLTAQVEDTLGGWVMQPDGSYVQRVPETPEEISSQLRQIRWAESRSWEAQRLRKRKPRGISRRNVR